MSKAPVMNEIVMPLAVSEDFSFSGIERNHKEILEESVHTMEDSSSVESNISHFSEMNNPVRKDLDVDVFESNSDSIMNDTVDTLEKMSVNAQEKNMLEEDNTCANYKTVSVNVNNMTKTTVINTSLNIISQSILRDIKKGFVFNSARPPVFVEDPLDKSRVVVQNVTSDAKSQTVTEDQTYPETTNVSCFRDDVSRMLSKADPSDHDDNESNSMDMTEGRSSTNVDQSQEESKLKSNNTNHTRSRRKRNLKFFFRNGRGVKFSEIEYVASNLRNAQPIFLNVLHYLLFGRYGSCNSGLKLSQTKRNILHFCGYPFNRDSEAFQKKRNCLARLPVPMLCQIHKAIIGKECDKRSDMVTELIEFLMEPRAFKVPSCNSRKKQKDLSAAEYTELMNIATTKPLPSVLVKKLDVCEIMELQNQIKSECKDNKADTLSDYHPPMYILKGPGKKLMSFEKIVKHVQCASRKIIELLHFVLYGRMEPVDICRRNILEFSGYLSCQKNFIIQVKSILTKLGPAELSQLCKILCLQARTNPKSRKIEKIMKYLSAPSEPVKRRVVVRPKKMEYSTASCFERTKEDGHEKSEYKDFKRAEEGKHCVSTKLNNSKSDKEIEEKDTERKLRDFTKICSNIECAAPSDLLELNDLLFIKPSDESEIHQRILDFTRFKFSASSLEYHYRKTLMHYMGFCVVRKIANLLDIENWQKASSSEDLSSAVINFLMEMKLPASHVPNMESPKLIVKSNCFKKTESLKEKSNKAEGQKELPESVAEDNLGWKAESQKENKKEVFQENSPKSDVDVWKESLKENSKKTESQREPPKLVAKNSFWEKIESLKEHKTAESRKETISSQYIQLYKEETKKSWSFLNHAKPTDNVSFPALHPSESYHKNSNHRNQILRNCKKEVFIHRLTKASEQSQNMIEENHDTIANGWSIQEDSTPLSALIHHPSDDELKQVIGEIIEKELWSITLGDLVKKVYCYYPKINLHYREHFIKAEAKQIVAQMRRSAVDTLNRIFILPSS